MVGDRRHMWEGGVMIDKGGVWWEVIAIPLITASWHPMRCLFHRSLVPRSCGLAWFLWQLPRKEVAQWLVTAMTSKIYLPDYQLTA